MRLRIRTRLTLISAAMMAAVLIAAGAFLYLQLRADVLNAVDAGLVSRAEAIVGALGSSAAPLPGGALIEPDEAFAQVLAPDGTILNSSKRLEGSPLLPPSTVATLRGRRSFETDVRVRDLVHARLLAVPVGDGRVVVVGASLEDRREALARLAITFAIGGPVTLALIAGVGWLVAGAALRPVERMRSEAAAISADTPIRRLRVPETGDELARLGGTLNGLLDRLGHALDRERRFAADASHELRTPLANLKAEIELALRRSRSSEELLSALRSAGSETDRLVRLAEDLLLLSRSEHGQLEAEREPTDVADLISREAASFAPRASSVGIAIATEVPGAMTAEVDPTRLRQALGNLIDNALRHGPPGSIVTVSAGVADGSLRVEVTDAGEGFPEGSLERAFEPFARLGGSDGSGGAGLGLAIVRAVAQGHGGSAEARNLPDGGASVVLTIPV